MCCQSSEGLNFVIFNTNSHVSGCQWSWFYGSDDVNIGLLGSRVILAQYWVELLLSGTIICLHDQYDGLGQSD